MMHIHAKVQGQRSLDLKVTVETNRRTDRRTDGRTVAIALPPMVMRSVIDYGLTRTIGSR